MRRAKLRAVTSSRAARSPVDLLAPDIAAVVGALALPPFDDDLLQAIRSFAFPAAELSGAVERTDHLVPGDPPVRVHVHRARDASGLQPCLYSMHGGGYVIGDPEMDDAFFDRVCPRLGLVGVSVEYRLAPETPYPGPLDDCHRGLVWTYAHAAELGIDRSRLGVGGVSAGGGLAAALALLAHQRAEVPVAFQLLDCPMLDDRQRSASSRLDGLPVWSRESNAFGWRSYLGDRYRTDDVPCTAAPARATDDDLAGLPPAFVSVGAVDGFLDEDVEYALRLNHAGVPAELHVYPGACHGYHLAEHAEVTRQSRRDIEHWLARQIRR
jgi:acetyl esterase/lipase